MCDVCGNPECDGTTQVSEIAMEMHIPIVGTPKELLDYTPAEYAIMNTAGALQGVLLDLLRDRFPSPEAASAACAWDPKEFERKMASPEAFTLADLARVLVACRLELGAVGVVPLGSRREAAEAVAKGIDPSARPRAVVAPRQPDAPPAQPAQPADDPGAALRRAFSPVRGRKNTPLS
jgi:hypothetical protein